MTWSGQLREAEALGRFAKKLQTYLKPSVLVLDEVGYLPLSRTEANMMFQLVAHRYERGSIILTSNKAFSEWGAVTRRRGPGYRHPRPAAAPLRRALHQWPQLSAQGPVSHPTGAADAMIRPPRERHVRPYTQRHVRSYADTRRTIVRPSHSPRTGDES
jgi:hypothetical protein